MKKYSPEGADPERTLSPAGGEQALRAAFLRGAALEARAVLCDKAHNLHVDLNGVCGFMPREECALGIREGSTRDIAVISRVNKPVAFKIIGFEETETGVRRAILSRRALQRECMENYVALLRPGDVIDARVTHMEPFGAFCDIGAGICALLPIDGISVSRIPHPNVRFSVGEDIKAVVKSVDAGGRVTLSHKELLGTWEENAARFRAGETVPGIVRSVESYGVFVELAPNLAGLAERIEGPKAGDSAGVYIKSINPSRMKIKLILVDCFAGNGKGPKNRYFIESGHLDRWVYSPACANRLVETVFGTPAAR